MKNNLKKISGVTLLEVLLVMVIASSLIYLSVGYIQQRALQARIDRTAIQMQQILSAGLSYYLANSSFPTNAQRNCLLGITAAPCNTAYLPSTAFISPWAGVGTNNSVQYSHAGDNKNFYVWFNQPSMTNTLLPAFRAIAGMLPGGYLTNNASGANSVGAPTGGTCTGSGNCWVVAQVTVPPQVLNNATAVNFAGLYHQGGCVPVPTCPTDANGNAMTPQVMVVPVQVNGMNDNWSPGYTPVYPISSFGTYATGGPGNNTPPACQMDGYPASPQWVGGANNCSTAAANGPPSTNGYWRACIQIITERGNVQRTRTDAWGNFVTMLAITRCAANNEIAGSTWGVFTN